MAAIMESTQSLHRREFLLAATAGLVSGVTACRREPVVVADETQTPAWKSLIDLAKSWMGEHKWHKVDPYIRAAVELQTLGKEQACKLLNSFLQKYGSPYRPAPDNLSIDGLQIAPLCRMLFVKREGGEFRRIRYGSAGFVGGTDYADWPLDPIVIVDGVPFNVVTFITSTGEPEYAESYLIYCLENCDWNDFRFEVKSEAQKQTALQNLFLLPKLKNHLSDRSKELLSEQLVTSQ
jgi:hypothetical protein